MAVLLIYNGVLVINPAGIGAGGTNTFIFRIPDNAVQMDTSCHLIRLSRMLVSPCVSQTPLQLNLCAGLPVIIPAYPFLASGTMIIHQIISTATDSA